MKKNNLYFSALVLILGLSFTNCHSKSDNSLYQTNALLFNYLNGLLAGNCASVQKFTDASNVVTYVATGTTIPTGGCNAATQGSTYTTTASEIVTKSDAYFDRVTTILDTYSACSTMSSIVKGSIVSASLSSSTITALNAGLAANTQLVGSVKTATTAANIAATVATVDAQATGAVKNCKAVKIGLLYTAGVYCTTATDSTAAQANIKYYVVDSIQKDMNTSFEGNRTILSQKTTNDSINLYTKTAINAMRSMTSAEISTINSSAISPKLDSYALVLGLYANLIANSSFTALVSGAPSCLAAITAGDAVTKDYLLRIPSAYYTTLSSYNSDITFADRQAVTAPFIPSLTCKYGDGFTATTNTIISSSASTPAIGFCPTTYTKF